MIMVAPWSQIQEIPRVYALERRLPKPKVAGSTPVVRSEGKTCASLQIPANGANRADTRQLGSLQD
jgi:hypothetical protein